MKHSSEPDSSNPRDWPLILFVLAVNSGQAWIAGMTAAVPVLASGAPLRAVVAAFLGPFVGYMAYAYRHYFRHGAPTHSAYWDE